MYVDVPVPVDQPFEQLVHSTRDVHVPVPASARRFILSTGEGTHFTYTFIYCHCTGCMLCAAYPFQMLT